jgi:hypothetical protein
MSVPSRIFISYARVDDAPPPENREALGFVSYLRRQLRFEFSQIGGQQPDLWRDRERVPDGDFYEPLLSEGVAGSSLFLVVLSRNWTASPNCQEELVEFVRKFAQEPELTWKKRIVLVGKTDVPRRNLPASLRGQVGYRFYDIDKEDKKESPYFVHGEPGPGSYEKNAYSKKLGELARHLWEKVQEFSPQATVLRLPKPRPIVANSGRTVFLARPAGDMKGSYLVLLEELAGRGHRVLPDPEKEIPNQGSDAIAYVDAALIEAELSIHLLGERSGFAPDGVAPIVQLQLERAAARVSELVVGNSPDSRAFHRLIWAPIVLPDAGEDAGTRDPQEVLSRLQGSPSGQTLCPGDKLVGDTQVKFAQFVVEHLAAIPRILPRPSPSDNGTAVYLTHDESDVEGAVALAEGLRLVGFIPSLPALEGGNSARRALHRRNLRDCDIVVLCWAEAADIWIKANARELRDWQALGRSRPFDCRTVVALPPPRGVKNYFLRVPPLNDVDFVIDATGVAPTPEGLGPLLRPLLGN